MNLPHLVLQLQGFDEYMNLVLDQAEEVNTKTGVKRPVGK